MRLIVVGCRGAGKSSFVKAYSEKTGVEVIDYGNPIIINKDEGILENYIGSRRKFIEYTIETLDKTKGCDVIQARGPETLYTYSIYSPLMSGIEWKVDELLKPEFDILKTYYSDKVIMLDFPIDEINRRCKADKKERNKMDYWTKLWFEYERPYFLKFDNLIYLNNSGWDIDECVSYVISEIGEKHDNEL